MRKLFEEFMTAKGYYCNMCDTYHHLHEIKHRYVVECVGEWDGRNHRTIEHAIICPTCNDYDELEFFDRKCWSHLVAYQRATGLPLVFEYPIFDRENNGPTLGYKRATTAEKVEEIADWYCIDVESIRFENDEIIVRIEYQ